MPMKALVLGGTGFIGRRLVGNLLSGENEVTLATSGKSPTPFGDKVSTLVVDRFSRNSLMEAFSGNAYFDVAIDTIGYRSLDVKYSLEALEGKIGKYVYISSAAVYRGNSGTLSEESFDPGKIENKEPGIEKAYHEGKQMSEACILEHAKVPYAIARFPNVLGYDDSTMRFQDHVSRIVSGEEFIFQEPEGRRNCVWVEDAGNLLAWLSTTSNVGIYNGASPDAMKASELVEKMAEALGTTARISRGHEKSNSRYSATTDFVLNVKKAEGKGFKFHPTGEWLGEEARMAKEHGKLSHNSQDYSDKLFP